MIQCEDITATISLIGAITGKIADEGAISGVINLPDISTPVIPIYDGEYTVTPHFFEQTLETRDKMMTDDVTVEIIPAYEVPNIAGGLTVTIG